MKLPATLKAGDYTLALALEEPGALQATFRLAIDIPEKDGRYEVGRVRIE